MVANNLRGRLKLEPHRFLTLTVRSEDRPLREQVARLLGWFRRLRRDHWFLDKVQGGAFFIEVTRNQTTGLWHPHLHCLVEGKFIDQRELSRRWEAITGGSRIVHVKLIRDVGHAAKYVAKYSAKGVSLEGLPGMYEMKEAMAALKGLRICSTFGSWRGWRLTDEQDDGEWEPVAPLWLLLADAARGDERAQATIAALRRQAHGREVVENVPSG